MVDTKFLLFQRAGDLNHAIKVCSSFSNSCKITMQYPKKIALFLQVVLQLYRWSFLQKLGSKALFGQNCVLGKLIQRESPSLYFLKRGKCPIHPMCSHLNLHCQKWIIKNSSAPIAFDDRGFKLYNLVVTVWKTYGWQQFNKMLGPRTYYINKHLRREVMKKKMKVSPLVLMRVTVEHISYATYPGSLVYVLQSLSPWTLSRSLVL